MKLTNLNRQLTIEPKQVYKHFKGTYVEIICIAISTVDKSFSVVYKHCLDGKIWSRPLHEFVEEVDHTKYPEVTQQYRFELCNKIE